MKRYINTFLLTVILHILCTGFAYTQSGNHVWKAGIAREVITPQESMWLAGYASRDHSSEGTLHDIWIKVLALEDENGKKAVLVTSDLLGFPKSLSDRIRERLQKKYDLCRDQVILNSSHTHTGPVLKDALMDVYPLDNENLRKVELYTRNLEKRIVGLIGNALASMQPAKLYSQNGLTRFQVNRRNNKESGIDRLTDLNGPNDYSVPVIKVTNESGQIIAVAFGYACHATTLSSYKWSGDYPGFAQIELEKLYPGTTALFFQCAGADMNPLPRRSVALAQQYGRELAAAVDRVLNEEMNLLSPSLLTAYSEVELSLTGIPGKEELAKDAEISTGYEKRWASRLLDQISRGDSLIKKYPYPVELWKLGDQLIITLGGELVIDYTLRLKKMFGQEIFVLGYSNDVMSYIPSVRILNEGGYESESSQMAYGLAGRWNADTEELIISEVEKLADKINLKNSGR